MERNDIILPGSPRFIQSDFIYFTTKKVAEQYGEDWRKRYYEYSRTPDLEEGYLISSVQLKHGLLCSPLRAQNNPELRF